MLATLVEREKVKKGMWITIPVQHDSGVIISAFQSSRGVLPVDVKNLVKAFDCEVYGGHWNTGTHGNLKGGTAKHGANAGFAT